MRKIVDFRKRNSHFNVGRCIWTYAAVRSKGVCIRVVTIISENKRKTLMVIKEVKNFNLIPFNGELG